MISSTLQHLRIPFSYFLFPVYLVTVCSIRHIDLFNALLLFVILHLFVYPASNGFNSYYDKDTESIGGLKNPPPVSKSLLWVSLLFDLVALLLSLIIGWRLALALFIYGLFSKAYSWDKIRLKKYPVISLIVAASFSGAYTVFMTVLSADAGGMSAFFRTEYVILALLATAFLFASYPMTQVYQHESDTRRGDTTMSVLLGVKGTFLFAAFFFAVSGIGFILYYLYFSGTLFALMFAVCQLPTVVFFIVWMLRCFKNIRTADYEKTMILNFISATGLILFCVIVLVIRFYVNKNI
jgi:4-hydroxybenzoate polyprenyltransferase